MSVNQTRIFGIEATAKEISTFSYDCKWCVLCWQDTAG